MENKKLRREKINIMLNEDERKTITDKAIKYGYGNKLAEYVRDACIYEKIYVEDVKGKTEICKIVNDLISEVRIIQQIENNISKNITISKNDVDIIRNNNSKLNTLIDTLIKTVIKTLSTTSVQKHQKRLRLVEKYKISKTCINEILDKEYYLMIPKNLSFKDYKQGYLVILLDSEKSIKLDYINYDSISIMIDSQRENALQNNCYVFLHKKNNSLYSYLALYQKSKEEAMNYVLNNKNYSLYDYQKDVEINSGT